ncbi:hypothetical protein, partial [Vibrio cholerae]|uniref:hypothetical protein n=1 Tax=Vibrio cholerae TaxID=666 RepID=UPI0019697446
MSHSLNWQPKRSPALQGFINIEIERLNLFAFSLPIKTLLAPRQIRRHPPQKMFLRSAGSCLACP